jgi:hypothetical protein
VLSGWSWRKAKCDEKPNCGRTSPPNTQRMGGLLTKAPAALNHALAAGFACAAGSAEAKDGKLAGKKALKWQTWHVVQADFSAPPSSLAAGWQGILAPDECAPSVAAECCWVGASIKACVISNAMASPTSARMASRAMRKSLKNRRMLQ